MDDQKQNNFPPKADLSLAENLNQNSELDICKKQAEEYLNNWKRERADFVNYKKDEVKRMAEFIKFGNDSLILELLDTMDDLYLAAKEIKNSGLDQVINKFEDLLEKYGVEKITVGDKFDPMMHEVIAVEGDPVKFFDTAQDNGASKIEEVRAGYTMHGRVIRPMRVRLIK